MVEIGGGETARQKGLVVEEVKVRLIGNVARVGRGQVVELSEERSRQLGDGKGIGRIA